MHPAVALKVSDRNMGTTPQHRPTRRRLPAPRPKALSGVAKARAGVEAATHPVSVISIPLSPHLPSAGKLALFSHVFNQLSSLGPLDSTGV